MKGGKGHDTVRMAGMGGYYSWYQFFILGSFLMQILNETQRQKQSVETHAHQLKRLTGLVRHLETQNKTLLKQTSENNEDDINDIDEEQTITLDELLDEKPKS